MKRGELLGENSVGLLLAFLGLILIFGIVIYYFYNLNSDQASENAKTIVSMLKERANKISETESSSVLIREIEGSWYLLGWGDKDSGRPDRCYWGSCICICDGATTEACQGSNGFCRSVSGVSDINVFVKINKQPLDKNLDLELGDEWGEIAEGYGSLSEGEKETNYIPLGSSDLYYGLIQLKLEKKNEVLKIVAEK